MNILELNFERGWRGGERQTIYNMVGFRQAGVAVSLLCRKGTELERKAIMEGFKVHSFANIFGVLWFLILNGHRYSVMHAQTSHILTYCVFTKPFHKAKIIFSRRVNFTPKGSMTKLKYDMTDHITAVSESVKKVMQQFGVKKVTVISDVVVPRQLDKQRVLVFLKNKDVPESKKIIGTIAAMGPDKDPLTMVNAVKLLSERRNDFVFLHFGNGNLEDEVKAKVKEYNLEHIYLLMGFQTDIEDFYSVFDVFAMSSVEEGLGSSVLDAFIYRVPVVSTNAGGLADLLQGGRGIACRKGDADGMADGIDLILDQRELDKQMVTHAYQYAVEYHNIEYITAQYLSLLA